MQEKEFSIERNPIIKQIGEDLEVLIRSGEIYIIWNLKNISYYGKELNCLLVCNPMAVEHELIPFTTRINLLSSSARESLSRSLRSSFKLEVNWSLMINQLCTQVENFLSEAQEFNDLTKVEEDNTQYLLEPLIADRSANMIFGKGGTGKSYLSLAISLAIATGKPFLDFIPTAQKKVLFLDYESTKNIFAHRLKKVDPSFDREKTLFYYGMTAPLIDCVDSIKRKILEYDIGFVVIDSAALAAGGRPEEAENALNFFSAIKRLKTTVLVIAHETKSENKSYPFGSVFFFNNLRNIWNASSQQEDLGSNTLNLGLFHRKANEDKLNFPRGLTIQFGDRITFSKSDVDLWEEEQTLTDRIFRLIRSQSQTTKQICAELDINNGTARKTLQRMKEKGKIIKNADSWYLPSDPIFGSPS